MNADDERYFAALEDQLEAGMAVAERAREVGGDPTDGVEIPVAQDMADRVENILGIEGVAERVRELEGEMSREEAALTLAEDFAEGRVGDFATTAGAIEGAVRTAVALLTEGVVAAPIEGVDRVVVDENDDGTQFVRVFYAGPIRSAGGTAQALSVLVADYARTLLGVSEYRPRTEEVERYAEEVSLYDTESGLQYSPDDAETRFIAEHCPVMLDGEATGDAEVSGYRDLERVDTDNPRGGMCLVLAEGIALKAPKIKRYTDELAEVDWPWLDDLIEGTYHDGHADDATSAGDDATGAGDDAGGGEAAAGAGAPAAEAGAANDAGATESAVEGPPRVEPSKKYLRDLIAGRPVFSHPSEPGGFRLRYGRARNHGFATAGVHPATMRIVDDFLATGTQIKTEFPGKAAGVVPVDAVEGPTVRLANGDVRRIDDPEEAMAVRNGVEAVLDLGEYLVNYGEFVENNHDLAPAAYAVEWWREDLAAAGADVQALADDPDVDLASPSPAEAVAWARDHDAPLHPEYTHLWHDLTVEQFERLADDVAAGAVVDGDLRVERTPQVVAALEALLVEHRQREEWVWVPEWRPLALSLGLAADALAERSPVDRADGDDGREGDDGRADGDDRADGDGRESDAGTTGSDAAGTGDDDGETGDDEEAPTEDDEIAADGGSAAAESGAAGSAVEGPAPSDVKRWDDLSADAREWPNAVRAVEEVAPFDVRERAPTRVGARMGRPEKSEKRELSPAVHTLFPIGSAGGDQRDVVAATEVGDGDERGKVHVAVGRRTCEDCGATTYRPRCPDCEGPTSPDYRCPDCGQSVEPNEAGRVECPRCGVDATSVEPRPVDVRARLQSALETVGEREAAFDILKGVKGLTSREKTPEPLEKGVLRAKHGVSAFKDGTVRYDMTDLPVTAVRPEEVGATADQFRELGYETDVHDEPLRHDDQLVELKVQDVVLSDGCVDHLLRTADFVDDLLVSYYGLEPYYEVEERDDLVGKLVFGLAPHTSAAVVGRVVGFTSASVGYAHPYFHAAKRRNCFHPETKVWYRDEDGEWGYDRIETVVEERLDDPRTDDFGTLVEELDGAVRVPSIDDDGDVVEKGVTAVSKHPAPEHLLRVETASGRTVTVTPDHRMLRWADGGVERVEASALAVGEEVPVPASSPGAPETTVDESTVAVDGETGAADGGIEATTDGGVGAAAETVVAVDVVAADVDHTYSLTVADTHSFVADGVLVANCDGDEDCVLLLMDGLLNFSKYYLPDRRGGSMDAPLVMTTRIDPAEIDDEAHNVDVGDGYSKEFYEATREMADPATVDVPLAGDSVGTDEEYSGFGYTHDTTDVAGGPALSAYKTLGSMTEKMDAQLELARKLRGVDEVDVAERVIEYHFLPDLIGNLRAFTLQETRCLDCGEKYRRMPLSGNCRECGGDVNLTVHEGSVTKYMETARTVAEEYGAREYTKQRLEILGKSLESLFQNDKNKRSTLGEFM